MSTPHQLKNIGGGDFIFNRDVQNAFTELKKFKDKTEVENKIYNYSKLSDADKAAFTHALLSKADDAQFENLLREQTVESLGILIQQTRNIPKDQKTEQRTNLIEEKYTKLLSSVSTQLSKIQSVISSKIQKDKWENFKGVKKVKYQNLNNLHKKIQEIQKSVASRSIKDSDITELNKLLTDTVLSSENRQASHLLGKFGITKSKIARSLPASVSIGEPDASLTEKSTAPTKK